MSRMRPYLLPPIFCCAMPTSQGKIKLPDRADPSKGSGWILIAMGKHGAHELNYSSDIDLIVFFDPEAPAITDPYEATICLRG
jgi:glutamate-ammonia-ligase adenylyltransferase